MVRLLAHLFTGVYIMFKDIVKQFVFPWLVGFGGCIAADLANVIQIDNTGAWIGFGIGTAVVCAAGYKK